MDVCVSCSCVTKLWSVYHQTTVALYDFKLNLQVEHLDTNGAYICDT